MWEKVTNTNAMKTCSGATTNIYTAFLYNIMNQNYGDGYGNQNYLNYQDELNNKYGGYPVEISQISSGTSTNWYFQQIGDSNYYTIYNQNYGNGNGNQNYLTAGDFYVPNAEGDGFIPPETVEYIAIKTHSDDGINVWCIEPNGAYYSIRAFQNNNPGGYLDYYDASRSATLSSSPDASTNWHFQPVWSALTINSKVVGITIQPQSSNQLLTTQQLLDTATINNPSAATITHEVSYGKIVTNSQTIDWSNSINVDIGAHFGLDIPLLAHTAFTVSAAYEHSWGGSSETSTETTITFTDSIKVPENTCIIFNVYFNLVSGGNVPFDATVEVTADAIIGDNGLVQSQNINDIDALTTLLSLAGNTEKILPTDPNTGTITLLRTGTMTISQTSGETYTTSNPCGTTDEDSTTTPVHDDL